jgi:hypothetical protein
MRIGPYQTGQESRVTYLRARICLIVLASIDIDGFKGCSRSLWAETL